jgi:hypothetical protein
LEDRWASSALNTLTKIPGAIKAFVSVQLLGEPRSDPDVWGELPPAESTTDYGTARRTSRAKAPTLHLNILE